jgi:hypothetical protein
MNNDENPSTQALGQAVDDLTGIAAPGSPEGPDLVATGLEDVPGNTPGPVLEEISTNPPPVPGLQMEKLAGCLWHWRDGWALDPLHGMPFDGASAELVAELTTLARQVGPGSFRVTFYFEAR